MTDYQFDGAIRIAQTIAAGGNRYGIELQLAAKKLLLKQLNKALAHSDETPATKLSVDDLKTWFPTVPFYQPGPHEDEVWEEALDLLTHYGITTVDKLTYFIKVSPEIFDDLSGLYVSMLKREVGNNLDPLAIAGWAAKTWAAYEDVYDRIKASKEYAAANAVVPPAPSDADA
jgi:hypothetical protein